MGSDENRKGGRKERVERGMKGERVEVGGRREKNHPLIIIPKNLHRKEKISGIIN